MQGWWSITRQSAYFSYKLDSESVLNKWLNFKLKQRDGLCRNMM